MKIQDMFEKRITREIKGVIKVGQKDDENVYQELDEYVVTEELEKYMNRFFDAYNRSVIGRTDNMGVWISGFFGSGKSHFLKILSYILSNRIVENGEGAQQDAVSFFSQGVKLKDDRLKDKIADIAAMSDDIDVILFNIDSKSTTDSKINKEAIKDVFMKVFNDYLGYCGSIPFLADFERKLDEQNQYEAFKEKFEEIEGTSWKESREDYYFIQDSVVRAIIELGIMSEDAAKNWSDNAEKSYALSIDKFAEYVKRYCSKKGKNHHVLFLVDEIGQYIADDSKLMLNLQTVTEDLGTACGGKAWIIVTSQQDIDSITKTMGEDFSKIQGRFATRIALSSADADEVIKKRILYKKAEAKPVLVNLYQEHESSIKNIITFSEGTPNMSLYKDAEEFADVYPFIPYQFQLAGNVLTAVRQFSSSGKHLADGERSLLALFKEAAVSFADSRGGVLVPFNAFYSALDDFIDHTHRTVITQASRNIRLGDFDVELLKVLFMTKHVNNFKRDAENLTTLMISKVDEDRLVLAKKVEKSLRALCDEALVQKNGDEYIFLTNEEQEAELRIQRYNIEPKEIVDYVAQVAFEEVIVFPNNKYRYSARYQFSFNQLIDDRAYRNNISHKIGLKLLTAYSGKEDETQLRLLSSREKCVVVRLSDDYAYLSEIDGMKKIEAFLNDPTSAKFTDFEAISANKRKERSQKAKRISDYLRFALENADIYVAGERVSTKSRDVTARIAEAFEKLIDNEYHKLKCMETQPVLSDIMDAVKQSKTQSSMGNPEFGNEKNHEALSSVIEEIRYAGRHAAQYSIKQALDQFRDPPYGYTEEDIEYLIAVLYRKGQISLKMNSVIYTPASTTPEDAYKYITKREFREKVLLEIKEAVPKRHIKAVKDVIREFYGKSVTSDDQDILMHDYRSYAQTKKNVIESVIRGDYGMNSKLPGRKILEKALRLIDDTLRISDPISFYKSVDELYDDFIETGVDIGDLNRFLDGVQKEKYLHAVKVLNIYEKSKNYISEQTVIDYAEQVKKLLNVEKPYAFIPKLEECDKKLMNAIHELLDNDMKRIEPDIFADWKMAKMSIPADRPYVQRLLSRIDSVYEELLDKFKSVTDIAALNGIPSESNALLQNCLRMIQKEEDVYQVEIERKRKEKEKQGGKTKADPKPSTESVKVIKNKPVSFRSITGNKIYSIKSEEDIEQVLDELRTALKAQLEENAIIKLS
ncbi:MAG: BREX system P-loop protein BrxC [Lachnospiraceae bacterium]